MISLEDLRTPSVASYRVCMNITASFHSLICPHTCNNGGQNLSWERSIPVPEKAVF